MKLKRMLAFVPALCMVCAVVPVSGKYVPETAVSASAEEAAEGTYENLKYKKYADYVEISGVTDKKITEAVIPAKIKGLPVTSIADYAFYGCEKLTDVTFSNNITSIGNSAFHGCKSLAAVTIPDSVTSIGEMAFYGCTSLTAVTIPNSVISIGDLAFSDCTGLTAVTIPDSVTSIGKYAFFSCTGLTAVTIPDSVTSIGEQAFAGTPWLEEKKQEKQQENALVIINHILIDGTTCNRKKVTIPDGVTSIGGRAFYGCTNLTAVTIPDSVTDIGESAFSGCTNLTAVTIPDSVTGIGGSAFSGCTNLTAVTIPDSVTSIGESAFSYCENLKAVIIENPDCEIYDDEETLNNKEVTTIYGYENSTAQAYAENYGYKFESLGTAPETTALIPGDADGNGKVDIVDVIKMNKAILGKENLTDEQLKAVDFNNNSKPEASEALMIMKYIVGLITSFAE